MSECFGFALLLVHTLKGSKPANEFLSYGFCHSTSFLLWQPVFIAEGIREDKIFAPNLQTKTLTHAQDPADPCICLTELHSFAI